MEMKPVCYLDMDGVLCDLIPAALAFHKKTLAMRDVRWHFPCQVGFADAWCPLFWSPLNREFWSKLPWTKEGMPLLAFLEDIFGTNIALVSTGTGQDGCLDGKTDWVNDHAPAYLHRLVLTRSKHLLAGPGKIIVDDNQDNVEKFVRAGGKGILIPRPWNNRITETDEHGGFSVETVIGEVKRAAYQPHTA